LVLNQYNLLNAKSENFDFRLLNNRDAEQMVFGENCDPGQEDFKNNSLSLRVFL
jgi:hypothetical protein